MKAHILAIALMVAAGSAYAGCDSAKESSYRGYSSGQYAGVKSSRHKCQFKFSRKKSKSIDLSYGANGCYVGNGFQPLAGRLYLKGCRVTGGYLYTPDGTVSKISGRFYRKNGRNQVALVLPLITHRAKQGSLWGPGAALGGF